MKTSLSKLETLIQLLMDLSYHCQWLKELWLLGRVWCLPLEPLVTTSNASSMGVVEEKLVRLPSVTFPTPILELTTMQGSQNQHPSLFPFWNTANDGIKWWGHRMNFCPIRKSKRGAKDNMKDGRSVRKWFLKPVFIHTYIIWLHGKTVYVQTNT